VRRPATVLALAVVAACSADAAPLAPTLAIAPVGTQEIDGYSNVRRADYVGPEVCGDCHEEKHERWSASLHAAMNRRVDDRGAIRGDFSGVRVAYGGGVARFGRDGDGYVMDLRGRDGTERRFRVTRTIGSRYLQEYVGIQVRGPEPVEDARYRTEVRLPFGWWIRRAAWYPEPYFDSWYGPEYDAAGVPAHDTFAPDPAPWATRCAWCHNTYPFELRVARGVGHGLEQHVALDRAPTLAGGALPTDQLVSVGISCESCHLGGREHADNEVAISFAPRSPDLHRRAGAPDLSGGRHDPIVVDTICAQCHSTPAPRFPDGAAVRNSSEALDLAAGACAPAIACTDCHDPHTAGPGPGAPSPAAVDACTRCHAGLDAPDAARAHSRHPDGVTCLDCHMPRIVQGISSFVRTHRISSPTDRDMLAIAAPNACNLCHLDRGLAWTLGAIEDGWGRRITPEPSWLAAYGGSYETPMGRVWLDGAVRTYRIVAAAAYARSPLGRAALPHLLARLDDPVAFYRTWMLLAIEDLLGRRLDAREFDPLAPPSTRARQAARLRARSR